MSSPFAHADPPPFEERLLACQSPPLITRSGKEAPGGQNGFGWEKTARGSIAARRPRDDGRA